MIRPGVVLSQSLLSLLCLILVLATVKPISGRISGHGPSRDLTALSRRGVLVARDDSNTIPSSPPWFPTSDIGSPPTCCPSASNLVTECEAKKCVEAFIDSCMQTATLVDTSCVCANLTSDSCQDCSGDVRRLEFYQWLNTTCRQVSGWNGLPANWSPAAANLDLLQVGGTIYGTTCDPELDPTCPFENDIFVQYRTPWCVNSTSECAQFFAGWQSCIFNGTEVGSAYCPTSYSSECQYNLYLDRSCACGSLVNTVSSDCLSRCEPGINGTLYDLWLNRTCGTSRSFNALPANWTESLQLIDNSTYRQTSSINYPSCVTGSDCYSNLNATQWNLTSVRCILANGSCSSTPTALDLPPFCANVSYGKTCNDSCGLSWQRADLLNWMNNTCSTVPSWKGLPSNWTLLLNVQESELAPWAPVVVWNSSALKLVNDTSHAPPQPRCSSNGAKLGVFAAVNIVGYPLSS